MVMERRNIFLLTVAALFVLSSCKKDAGGAVTDPSNFSLSYGDSILYQKLTAGDYIVSPQNNLPGNYTAFPEGIEINDRTGAINLSKSETGLRYKINFMPDGSTKEYSTTVLLSGINYLDAFYYLSKNDTVALPVYNGNPQASLPLVNSGTAFDIGLGCNNEGIAVSIKDGKINLAQTIRNGFFGRYPDNGTRREFELKYKIDDKSQQFVSTLKIKLYYFETMNDVTPDLIQLLQDRQGTVFGPNMNAFAGELMNSPAGIGGIAKAAKPRPPCIFIIGR